MQAVYNDGTEGEQLTARGAQETYLTLAALLADAKVESVRVTRQPRPETWRRAGKKGRKQERYF